MMAPPPGQRPRADPDPGLIRKDSPMTLLPPSPHAPAYSGVDLASCDDEPIHVPGAIQPHGVLLAVDPPTMRVVMASRNTGGMLGVAVEDVLDATLGDVVGERLLAAVVARWDEQVFTESLVLHFPTGAELGGRPEARLLGAEIDVRLHVSDDLLVVELEPYGRPRSVLLSYHSARSAMSRLSGAGSVEDLGQRLAEEIRGLTLFDRVMVYKFDPEWNGEVIAEARREDLNSFLGLHYPAGDIPAQARRLYTVSWTRLIADVDYVPVALEPVLVPDTGRPIDLSLSSLRSVSPIHVEYLQNMGVDASMSVSLVHDDELWGLVACHHYSGPHRPSHDARAAAEFLGQVASAQFADREAAEGRRELLEAGAMLSRITTRLTGSSGPLPSALVDDPEILDLVGASGVAFCHDGELFTRGDVPSDEVITLIARRLTEQSQLPTGADEDPGELSPTYTDDISSLDEELAGAELPCAGALVFAADASGFLLWLRRGLPQVVEWGGDPRTKEGAHLEDGQARLSPRKSFEKWSEIVKGRSTPWSAAHVDVASTLQRQLGTMMLKRSREQVAVAQSLQRSVVAEWTSQVEGLDVAVRYLPATTYQLGGDWWDLLELDDERVILVIGDVAGHGVSAVAAMTQVRASLRAYLFAGMEVAEALDHLDRMMARVFDARVASACVVVVNRVTRETQVALAGHPEPLICGKGPLPSLEGISPRPVLGLGMGHASLHSMVLPEGTTMVLYTDGLVERRGQDLLANIEALQVSAGRGPVETPLEEWIDGLMDAVPGETDDDTTVIAFRL